MGASHPLGCAKLFDVLETFTCATFEPHLGGRFRLEAEPGSPIDVVLTEATVLGASAPARGRPPFSIVFRGPPDEVLPQRIYRLEHPAIGAFELFLVPIERDQEGVRYEAIFT